MKRKVTFTNPLKPNEGFTSSDITPGLWKIGKLRKFKVDEWEIEGFPIMADGRAIGVIYNGYGNGKANAELV